MRALLQRVSEASVVAGVRSPVASGRFASHMQVHLVNDGPVTILLDSKKKNA